MIKRTRISTLTRNFVVSAVVVLCGRTEAGIIGQWTFESGEEQTDLAGNFDSLVLNGSASVSGGALHVSGFGTTSTGWASAASNASSPFLGEKTLVTWLTLNDLSATFGAPLGIDDKFIDKFDSIVFAERSPNRWMAGSTNFLRSGLPSDFAAPEAVESAPGEMIQMAISYRDLGGGGVEITGYRNGVLLGQYTDSLTDFFVNQPSEFATWDSNTYEALFGIRATIGIDTFGALNASIFEARIYDEVLTQSQIQSLNPAAVPEPGTFVVLLGSTLGAMFVRCRTRKTTGTQEDNGDAANAVRNSACAALGAIPVQE
jgi:hypothetical protein